MQKRHHQNGKTARYYEASISEYFPFFERVLVPIFVQYFDFSQEYGKLYVDELKVLV